MSSYDVAGHNNDKTVLTIRRVICYVVLILLTVLSLFPFLILIINSTRSHVQIQQGFSMIPGNQFFVNFKNAIFGKTYNGTTLQWNVFGGMLNSFIVAGCATLLSVYFSAFTAYGVHVYDFKLRKFAFTFILVIMMVPSQVSALGFVNLVTKMGLKDSLIPLIIPTIAAPSTFYFMKQYMESSLPLEIVEAARIDGCNEFRTFNSIIVPILKPAFAVQAIFTFVTNWNNYFIPSLIISKDSKKTLPILIAQLRSADFTKFDMGQLYFTIMIAIVPVVIVYLCLSKFIICGVTLGSVKG